MATNKQIIDFIVRVGQAAQNEASNRTKWVLPSVCVAQGALESRWGTSGSVTHHNAVFGIKATQSYIDSGGLYYTAVTQEEINGQLITTTANFRAYESIEDSIHDYYNLICNSSHYHAAVNNPSYEATIQAIKDGGYSTSSHYVTNVLAMYHSGEIRNHPLTTYDVGMGSGSSFDPLPSGMILHVEADDYNSVIFCSSPDVTTIISQLPNGVYECSGTIIGSNDEYTYAIITYAGMTVYVPIYGSYAYITEGSISEDIEQDTSDLSVGSIVRVKCDTIHGKKYGIGYTGIKFRNRYRWYRIYQFSANCEYAFIGRTPNNLFKVKVKYLILGG